MKTVLNFVGKQISMIAIVGALYVPISYLLTPSIGWAVKRFMPPPMCHCPRHPTHPLEGP